MFDSSEVLAVVFFIDVGSETFTWTIKLVKWF